MIIYQLEFSAEKEKNTLDILRMGFIEVLRVKEQSQGLRLDFGQAAFASFNLNIGKLQEIALASTDDRKRMGTLAGHCKTQVYRCLCSSLLY